MELIPQVRDNISKTEIEQIQESKKEFTNLGTYLYTRGLQIFAYNPMTSQVIKIEVVHGNTIHIEPKDGVLTAIDKELEKVFADPRLIYFEALNMKTTKDRVAKWKSGKIPELFNLRKPNLEPIKFY